jgi:ABC-type branched-subunit amino acid transport system ATPase component
VERSAEWLRNAVEVLEMWGSSHYDSIQDALTNYRAILAEAEAREASAPTAANGAGTLTLSETIAGLREACAGVVVSKREVLTAEEVIAACEKALEKLLRSTNTIEVLGEYEALEINAGSRRTMRAHVDAVIQESRDALAAIAKWKEAQM